MPVVASKVHQRRARSLRMNAAIAASSSGLKISTLSK